MFVLEFVPHVFVQIASLFSIHAPFSCFCLVPNYEPTTLTCWIGTGVPANIKLQAKFCVMMFPSLFHNGSGPAAHFEVDSLKIVTWIFQPSSPSNRRA